MSTKSSLRIQSDSCSIYAHTCWQVDCDNNIFSSFIVQNWLRKHPPVRTCTISCHVPFTFSSPQVPEVSSCYTGWHPWATAVLEAHSCSQEAVSMSPSASSRFPSGTPLSPDPRARCLKTADTRTDTLQYLQHILELSWLDQHVHCRLWQVTIQCVATCLSFSHWLTVIQEESHLQMSKTRMNSEITCFNKNVLRWWWQRHVQNSSSWTSRKPGRRERDIKHIYIFKSGNPSTHWLIDSVELDRNGKYHKRPDWTSWNCTDCDCRGKLFRTIQGCLWLYS